MQSIKWNLLLPVFLTAHLSGAEQLTGNSDATPAEPALRASACSPEVLIEDQLSSWKLCLNRMIPSGDSCADVIIDCRTGNGAAVQFHYNGNQKWHYAGTTGSDTAGINSNRQFELINDPDGNLVRATIYQKNGDTLHSANLQLHNDIPVVEDTLPPINFIIRRNVYLCEKEYRVVIEERIWTYPPGYRYRAQILNYPELSMFHYGGSVRMPTSASLQERAAMIFTYHILHPKEIAYDDPEKIMKTEAWLNRFRRNKPTDRAEKKKSNKPPLVFFRPIN